MPPSGGGGRRRRRRQYRRQGPTPAWARWSITSALFLGQYPSRSKPEPVPESYRVVGFNACRLQYTMPNTEPDDDDAHACRHEHTILHTEPDSNGKPIRTRIVVGCYYYRMDDCRLQIGTTLSSVNFDTTNGEESLDHQCGVQPTQCTKIPRLQTRRLQRFA